MKKLALISVHIFTAAVLLSVACSYHAVNKLKGDWVTEDGAHTLKTADETFAFDAKPELSEDIL